MALAGRAVEPRCSTPRLHRRDALLASVVTGVFGRPRVASAEPEGLLPLDDYIERLDACARSLEAIADELERTGESIDLKTYARMRESLHVGELGRFWVTARGCDKRASGTRERSPFAREKEDMWALIPEKSGPLGRLLRPDFDNPDDKLCLIYSCVNDPSAPASINTLYSLKLFDEGLRAAAKGERATPEGLSFVARDVLEKLATYRALVIEKADRDMLDDAWVNPAPTRWSGVGI